MSIALTHPGNIASKLRQTLAGSLVVVTTLAATPASASPQTNSATSALSWLRVNALQCDGSISGFSPIGGTADGVFAIAAGGQDPHTWTSGCGNTPISYLKAHAGDAGQTAASLGKIAIAAKVSGENPRSFGGVDLVKSINAQQLAPGRYGVFLFDQAFAILGLAAAGEAIPEAALSQLFAIQNADGGWSWTGVPDQGSDTNSTAVAVQALLAAKARGSALAAAIDLSSKRSLLVFHREQNLDGGFGYQKVWGTDSSSTAYSIQSLRSSGEDPKGSLWSTVVGAHSPISALLSLQNPDGAFEYQAGTGDDPSSTAQAVPGVVEKSFVCLIGLAACPTV